MFVKHGPCSIVTANRELIHLLLDVALVADSMPFSVMAGLTQAIHVVQLACVSNAWPEGRQTACAKAIGWDDVDGGTSPAMTARAVNLSRFIAKARPASNSQRRSPHLSIDRYRVRCRSSRFAFQPLTLFETRFFEL
jgi:hypothetical protein